MVSVMLKFGLWAITFLASANVLAAVGDACTQEAPVTVCNIAWPEGCRQVEPMKLPACSLRVASTRNDVSSTLSAPLGDFAAHLPARVGIDLRGGLISALLPDPVELAQFAAAQQRRQKADSILAKLDANPLDATVQAEARLIIRACHDGGKAKTPREMYDCSGFLVTPMVRLNCIANGACMPTPWKLDKNGMPVTQSDWAMGIAYDKVDTAQHAMLAFARPWVASADDIRNCRNAAEKVGTSGADERTVHCLALRMGGKSAELAMTCFKKHPNDPVRFSACLPNVKLDQAALTQARCILRNDGSDACLKAMGVNLRAIKNCRAATPGNLAATEQCIAALPKAIGPAAECVRTYRGDYSATAHCFVGVGMANTEREKAALKCGVNLVKGSDAVAQKEFLKCVGADATKVAQAVDKYQDAVTCLRDPSKDWKVKAKCARDAGIKIPNEVALAQCAAEAKTNVEIAACAGTKDVQKIAAAQECLRQAGGDNTKRALCIAGQLDLPHDQKRVLQCATTSRNTAEGIVCVAGPSLPRDVANLASCALSSQGSFAGTAICLAGPSMNAELRIGAECIATSGGEPMSFVGCAGGRLTLKELQQCIAGGFKPENGCFGENNEILKFYQAQEALLRGSLKVLGLETAYQNMLNDLKSGKLGENNEINRVLRLMNDIATKPPEETVRNALNEAAKVGKHVADGARKLGEEIGKVQSAASSAIAGAISSVPTVTGRTDLPGGVTGSVKVGPLGGNVSVGDVGVGWGPVGPSVKVGPVRVCVPWC